MTVVVTGAAGLLGRHVVDALRDAGEDVRAVDRAPAPGVLAADLTDLGAAVQALEGADAVVHAAAIPRPTGVTGQEVVATNVMAAWAVAEAARVHGVRRIVSASSFSVLGWPFNPRPLMPAYLPIDEAHPLAPQEPYALSKLLTEQVLEAAVRRSDVSVISLRMPWIQTAATFAEEVVARRGDPDVSVKGLWAYLDARDAADAFVAALRADADGHRAVYLSAPDTFMDEPTAGLVRSAFGDLELRASLDDHASVIATDAADALLGVRATTSWRTYGAEA